jgi:hypothetical protein
MPLDGLGRMARGAARVLVLVMVLLVLVLLVLLVLLALLLLLLLLSPLLLLLLSPLLLMRWLVIASGATHVAQGTAAAPVKHNQVMK